MQCVVLLISYSMLVSVLCCPIVSTKFKCIQSSKLSPLLPSQRQEEQGLSACLPADRLTRLTYIRMVAGGHLKQMANLGGRHGRAGGGGGGEKKKKREKEKCATFHMFMPHP